MIVTTLELAKVYIRLDQPNKALEIYLAAAEKHPGLTWNLKFTIEILILSFFSIVRRYSNITKYCKDTRDAE